MSSSITLQSRPAFAKRVPDDTSSLAIVSTYLLDSNSDTRSGSLCIVEVTQEDHVPRLVDEITMPAGVFRFDFVNPSRVVAALTDGSLAIQEIRDSKSLDTIPVSSDMLLDIGLSSSDSSLIATTDNKGHAYIVDMNTSLVVSSWLAHSLPYVADEGCEVWSCAFSATPSIVATGGEDATMKLWDSRTRTSIAQCKLFEAGVVFVDFLGDSDVQLITGSYDEHIRILDRRNLKTPLNEKKMSGGVWNIETTRDATYCVACMYGGYAIVDEHLNVVYADESAGRQLLYGATVVRDANVLYCTFNDYRVTIGEINQKIEAEAEKISE